MQIIDTQKSEYSMKKDFWIQHKEEKIHKANTNVRDEDVDDDFHTETELLIRACDKIKQTLKHVCSVIIFKDVRDYLKQASIELEQIKVKISKSGIKNEIKLEKKSEIDPDDKEFISQNFIENSYVSNSRCAVSEVSVFEFQKKTEDFPFSHYEMDKLESVLSQFGKN